MQGTTTRVFLFGGVFLAELIAASIASAQQPLYNPANGHYYRRITSYSVSLRRYLTFNELLTQAAGMSHLGVAGHLATITSQSEQDFLNAQFVRLGPSYLDHYWVGASDAAVEGEWRWVTGPEAGQLFWLGDQTGTAFGFHDWGRHPFEKDILAEPNNADVAGSNGEDYAMIAFHGTYSRPYWNDISNATPARYALVEFSPVPEPMGFLLGAAVIPFFAVTRRRFAPHPPRRRLKCGAWQFV